MRKAFIPVRYLLTMISMLAMVSMIVLFNPGIAQDVGNDKRATELVTVDVIVKDAIGKPVTDLKKEEVEIYEDGVLQEITDFRPVNQPLRLILLFDTSVSMGAIYPAIKDEAVKFVESLSPLDEITVASFNTSLQWHTDWSGKAAAENEILDLRSASVPARPIGGTPRRMPRIPLPLPPGGGRIGSTDVDTNLYGALHTLFERFGGRGGNERVLLFSDGKDSVDGNLKKERPVKDPKQIIQKAQESWAQIFAACFNSYKSDCKLLTEIADATGGRAIEFENQSDIALVLKKTLDELRSQYSIAYSSSSQGKTAGLRKIRTVVKRPDVIARGRAGYLVSK